MATPVQISTALPEPSFESSPFQIGGNLYVPSINIGSGEIGIFTSSDSGSTWSQLDAAHDPTQNATFFSCDTDGTNIYIACSDVNNFLSVYVFDTITELWLNAGAPYESTFNNFTTIPKCAYSGGNLVVSCETQISDFDFYAAFFDTSSLTWGSLFKLTTQGSAAVDVTVIGIVAVTGAFLVAVEVQNQPGHPVLAPTIQYATFSTPSTPSYTVIDTAASGADTIYYNLVAQNGQVVLPWDLDFGGTDQMHVLISPIGNPTSVTIQDISPGAGSDPTFTQAVVGSTIYVFVWLTNTTGNLVVYESTGGTFGSPTQLLAASQPTIAVASPASSTTTGWALAYGDVTGTFQLSFLPSGPVVSPITKVIASGFGTVALANIGNICRFSRPKSKRLLSPRPIVVGKEYTYPETYVR